MIGYLLDTNACLWLALDDTQLTPAVRKVLIEAPLFVSVVSAAEIAIKVNIGKLSLPAPFHTDFGGALRTLFKRSEIEPIPLGLDAVDHLRGLPLHHRDPFDRIIIAQAFALGLTVATRDRAFFAYDGLDILEI